MSANIILSETGYYRSACVECQRRKQKVRAPSKPTPLPATSCSCVEIGLQGAIIVGSAIAGRFVVCNERLSNLTAQWGSVDLLPLICHMRSNRPYRCAALSLARIFALTLAS